MEAASEVMVVDPDDASRARVAEILATRRTACVGLRTAREALAAAAERPPDVLITDLYLPDLSGFGLCRTLRETPVLRGIPVLVLTAQSGEIDRVLAFEAGADDLLAKPYYPPELVARVAALLRFRARGAAGDRGFIDESAPVRVDRERGIAETPTGRVELTPTELTILACLLDRSGRVVGRRELIEELWGAGARQSERIVDAHVKSIRRKLGAAREFIETVRGVGYRVASL